MNESISLENQLLVTKFYVPVPLGPLISRPRLTSLLNKSLKYPLTLVSAAAGFGKTTLLAAWKQALPANTPRVAWISLDEEDNEPRLFWASVLTALNMQQPDLFTDLLMQLQSSQSSPLKYLLAELISLLAEGTDHFLLILDDYQLITQEQVHTTLAYLIEYLPAQLRIILATRADPPLPLPLLRARKQALEVRTDHLRCTLEETQAFLHEVMGLSLSEEVIQEVTTRTEGWLVGLQLLGLSLPEHVDPLTLLEEVSGDQRYILDYLTEEVLRRQPQDVQTFLLSTSILEQLNVSLCDAIMEQTGSQQMLQRIEQANLFVVSLDSKRQWYRYHALFAQALHHQLEQTRPDLLSGLHQRASLWYTQYQQTTQAILHAFSAKKWQWAADLIERTPPLLSYTWGASEYELVLLQQWLELFPVEVMGSRPYFCLTCTQILWLLAPFSMSQAWLDAAEATLTTSLLTQTHEDASHRILSSEVRQEQENLLGEVFAIRAFLQSYQQDGEAAFSICQQALALLSADNYFPRILIAWAHMLANYYSMNDAEAAIESGLQGISLAQASGKDGTTLNAMCTTARHMIGAGRLHEAHRLIQKAMGLGTKSGGLVLPEVGWSTVLQAEILREWNDLDAARSLVEKGIELCKQSKTIVSLAYIVLGYTVLMRVSLSQGDLDTAQTALEQFERIGRSMNQPCYLYLRSISTTVDQVRLWLACEEQDRATHWAEQLELIEQHAAPFELERQQVAYARILLAITQPTLALERLEPVLERATTGQRWGHVIEIRLLQALASHILSQETQALSTLSEAVRLAEPEGYIRSFLDEGAPMEALLYHLRRRDRKCGPTPYLDTLLAAFQQESSVHAQTEERTQAYQLPEPLSQREREVLQLLVQGASNLEIAQELVITVDTVKRHTSHIFSKLGVHNRMQAMLQARELGLLDEEV